jgi:hypothetical protein
LACLDPYQDYQIGSETLLVLGAQKAYKVAEEIADELSADFPEKTQNLIFASISFLFRNIATSGFSCINLLPSLLSIIKAVCDTCLDICWENMGPEKYWVLEWNGFLKSIV